MESVEMRLRQPSGLTCASRRDRYQFLLFADYLAAVDNIASLLPPSIGLLSDANALRWLNFRVNPK
jgi:hypothetical protein